MSSGLLCIERDGRILAARPLGSRPLLIGRDEGCDVVVPDADVSRQHLLVWMSSSGLRVRDLWSSYGTRVGGTALRPGETADWPEGVFTVLAGDTRLATAPLLGEAPAQPVRQIEDLQTGLLLRLPLGRLLWRGQGRSAWIEATLRGVTATEGERTVQLPPGETIEVAGQPLRLHDEGDRPADPVTTSIGMPYQVRFSRDASGKPVARFESIVGDLAHSLAGETRVALIERLAREQLRAGRVPAWVPDRLLAAAVWGVGASDAGPRINTLVSRIRRTLEEAGLPRALLLKEDGRTAISVIEVSLPERVRPREAPDEASPPSKSPPEPREGLVCFSQPPVLAAGSSPSTAKPLVGVPRRPMLLGRSLHCDVVIPDLRISRRQVLLWAEGGRAWLRALPRGNATKLGGRLLEAGEVSPWHPGEVLTLAGACSFQLLPPDEPRPTTLLIADLDGALQLHLGLEPVPIAMPGTAPVLVMRTGGGAAILGNDGSMQRIASGEALPAPRRRLVLVPLREHEADEQTFMGPPFALRVQFDYSAAGRAEVEDLRSGRTLVLQGASRVALLYVLAKRCVDEAVPSGFCPWVEDAELAAGIWGARATGVRSRLNVLLSRIRAKLEAEGFPAGLIQKEDGRTRLAVGSVDLL